MKIIFIIIIFSFLIGCQKHDHTHQHDAPGSYKQSVNQQIHLPLHIEQICEDHMYDSDDINLQADVGMPGKKLIPIPQKTMTGKPNVKK